MLNTSNCVTGAPHLEGVDFPAVLKSRLQHLATSDKVAHLWVFISPVADLATAIARAFLLDWLKASPQASCHPDLLELKTSGKVGLHSIASIRHMLGQLALAPHGPTGRAVLIDAADRMLPPTANALLKALEEPPPSTVIILTSSSPHLILPTILSRAQTIHFPGTVRADSEELSTLIELLCRDTPVAYSTLMKACEAMQKGFEHEQSLLAKQLNEKKPEETGELSAAAKQEMVSEAEAGLVLWCQNRSKKILEELYLTLRNRLAHDEGLRSADPAKRTQLLLQAMNGIDRGADLSTMLMWFISQMA
jgi:DNA polymerase III delta prime subunit